MPLTLATEKTDDSDADDSSSQRSWSDSNWTHVKFSIFEIFDDFELEISAKYYFETYQT